MVDYKKIADYFIDAWCELYEPQDCLHRLISELEMPEEELSELGFGEEEILAVVNDIQREREEN